MYLPKAAGISQVLMGLPLKYRQMQNSRGGSNTRHICASSPVDIGENKEQNQQEAEEDPFVLAAARLQKLLDSEEDSTYIDNTKGMSEAVMRAMVQNDSGQDKLFKLGMASFAILAASNLVLTVFHEKFFAQLGILQLDHIGMGLLLAVPAYQFQKFLWSREGEAKYPNIRDSYLIELNKCGPIVCNMDNIEIGVFSVLDSASKLMIAFPALWQLYKAFNQIPMNFVPPPEGVQVYQPDWGVYQVLYVAIAAMAVTFVRSLGSRAMKPKIDKVQEAMTNSDKFYQTTAGQVRGQVLSFAFKAVAITWMKKKQQDNALNAFRATVYMVVCGMLWLAYQDLGAVLPAAIALRYGELTGIREEFNDTQKRQL